MNAAFTREALVAALFARRRKQPRSARSRPQKPTRWLYPLSVERRYAAAVRAWLRPMKEFVHEYLKNNREAMLRGDAAALVRQDAVPGGSYRRMVRSLNGWLTAYTPPLDDDGNRASPPVIFAGLGNIAEEVNDFNGKQWDKSANAALGAEFPVYEDWWPTVKEDWTRTNYELMRGLGQDYIKQVNTLAERAVISGWSPARLANEIMLADRRVSKVRAELIAADRIGTLNGMVTQARMEGAGLTMYLWSTSGDGRVRHAHALMDGALCRWDDSSVYSDDGGKTWQPRPSGAIRLHPGIDLRCRCCALSYWDELVDEADAKIAEIEKLEEMAKPASARPAPSGGPQTPVPPAPPAPEFLKFENDKGRKIMKRYNKYRETSKNWVKSLTTDEDTAMIHYTGYDYSDMNDLLFDKPLEEPHRKKEYEKYIKDLDEALLKYPLEDNIVIYRGAEPQNHETWKTGGEYTIAGYQSAAVLKKKAWSKKGMVITIRVPKGTPGAYIDGHGKHPKEEEYLLARELKYKVLEKTEKTMEVEIVL